MDRFLNLDIMRHPMNWVTLTLMFLLAGIAFHVVSGLFTSNSGTT